MNLPRYPQEKTTWQMPHHSFPICHQRSTSSSRQISIQLNPRLRPNLLQRRSIPHNTLTMLNMIDPITPPLDRHTRPLTTIVLSPCVHAVHHMPLLRRVKHRALRIRQFSHLLARDGSCGV